MNCPIRLCRPFVFFGEVASNSGVTWLSASPYSSPQMTDLIFHSHLRWCCYDCVHPPWRALCARVEFISLQGGTPRSHSCASRMALSTVNTRTRIKVMPRRTHHCSRIWTSISLRSRIQKGMAYSTGLSSVHRDGPTYLIFFEDSISPFRPPHVHILTFWRMKSQRKIDSCALLVMLFNILVSVARAPEPLAAPVGLIWVLAMKVIAKRPIGQWGSLCGARHL